MAAQNLRYGTYYSNPKVRSGSPNWRLFGFAGIIMVVVLGIGLYAVSLLNSSSKNDLTLLAVRESSLLTLANSSTKTIRDPNLATANSNTTILLAGDVSSLSANAGITQLPANLVTSEADTNTNTLKQAVLLDKFDSTYQQIVVQKVVALISEAQTVRGKLSSKASRDVVDGVIVNLQSIDKQFTQLTNLQ